MTIIYPDGVPTFWQFLCGDVPGIVVHAQRIAIPPELVHGDYSVDAQTGRRSGGGWNSFGKTRIGKSAQVLRGWTAAAFRPPAEPETTNQ